MVEKEDLETVEASEASITDPGDAAVVEVDGAHFVPTEEDLGTQESKVVSIQEDHSGVHGDLPGNVSEAASRALDHVEAPGLVMVAGAGVRAFHAAVAGQEGAAATEGEAVLGVVT